ncbi:proteasome accessory factor PafA2 family protein [Bifidobacterium moukalabense]|uniref:proteasome accessory factor PafA2 family protein n=1 Tax=Bifidobacterium moukalabense TaxID=1333651 RepID=UPI0010FA0A21|nr:proteasome accessory factor PafA2 family protein [Bifidobacterium moukalabense]
MPQLRDSGNHSTAPLDGRTRSEVDAFTRIFGIETEYGVSVTGADAPCDSGQTAMMMFQPIVARSRSTNTYIENGSRLYLDVGSHPEYATAEARDPMDALALDMAGELVMHDLAMDAQRRLRASHGKRTMVHVFKNNADSAGHSFGCHENYLVRRFVPLTVIEHELLPFLITRQIFTGAGRVGERGFQVTQRADFLDEAVSSATTRSRPMVNTRDEPHADPDAFRRLHVIIGDSNRSQWATMMKLATTHLVLCVIEQAGREGRESGFARLAFVDPGAANHAVSRDVSGVGATFDMADGGVISGGAVAMQERYLVAVERFVEDHPEVVASLPRTDVHDVIRQWRTVLETFGSGDADVLADRVDWICKRRLFDALQARTGRLSTSRLEQLDMDYHDVANGTVYASLCRRGGMRTMLGPDAADHALRTPPSDTRAVLRGRFVREAKARGARYSCDWTRLTLMAPQHSEMVLLDPFDFEESERFRRMLGSLD